MKLSPTATYILKERYLLKNNKGKIIETPEQMFRRVAREIAKIDKHYKQDSKKSEKEFYNTLVNLDFLPNSPTLMNAGTKLGQLSACFVLPVEDSIEEIFEALKYMAVIHQSGGGVGYSFSKLRPKNDFISTSKGLASGPVSFMKIFDKATEVIKQGGKRRGANIGILNIDHPDILEFINAKKNGELSNFNISVAITDKFMKALAKNQCIELISPRTKKAVKKIRSKKIFDEIVNNAWLCGDPGIIFIDEINRKNTLKLGMIQSTNPCGEQPLYPYESCNLGSINLSHMLKNNKTDFEKLRKTIHIAVHFLDNVIDANNYPLKEIEEKTKDNRKIGLGIMGFAEMLVKLNIQYNSEEAIMTAENLMKFVTEEARKASIALAKKRGSFPNFKKSALKKYKYMRNSTLTTIAPTGTISLIANTSSGIEPLFAPKYERFVGKKKFTIANELYGKYPKKLFVTFDKISPEWHVKIQAAFQKHTNNAVSKTVNLPQKSSKSLIREIFMLAYKLKCKGITVYRYGSKSNQILNVCTTC